jgi:hypothetical protein
MLAKARSGLRLTFLADSADRRLRACRGLRGRSACSGKGRATRELLAVGEVLLPVLDKALAGQPSSESRRRLEGLRGKLTGTTLQGERLRVFRAVEVLEMLGTPQARQVLRALAGGAPEALVTRNAQAALRR